jgi:hypothetical protein
MNVVTAVTTAQRTKTMKMFTIETGTNNITVHATVTQAEAVPDAERFSNQAGLAKLAARWPAARLVEIWNSLPGAKPVHKFTDRNKALARIWKALQSLGQPATEAAAPAPPVAPPTPRVAPVKPSATRTARKGKKAPPPAPQAKPARQGSKTGKILDLLHRPGGATLKEIMKATTWQAHSVRGFISATVGKKLRLAVVSARTSDGERSYSIEA